MDENLAQQAEELAYLASRLMRALSVLGEEGPAVDLPLAQLRACGMLTDGPRTISQLAQELGTTVSAVTQIADRLEAAGMVERLPGKDDRRTRHLQLTAHGARLLQARREQKVHRAAEVLGRLAPAVRRELIGALRQLISSG